MPKSRSGLSYDELDRLRAISASRAGTASRVRKAYYEPQPPEGTTGLRYFDLRLPAMRLLPVISILRNRIPRVDAPRNSTGLHWKAITGINTGNVLPGVSEGNRNAPIAQSTAEYFQSFAGLGMENYNTFEAKYSMMMDAEALARLDALESLINAEERVILGGNASMPLGVAPTPVGATVPTGGALTAQTWSAYVVALTFEGILLASVAGGVATEFVRTNADGSTDNIQGGSSMRSAISVGVASSGTQSILWKWASVPGAAGYAVYLGTTAGGTAARLAAIVTSNEYLQSVNPSGVTQQVSAITADKSANPLVFDGIITQIVKPGSGGTFISANGSPLTVNTAGIIEQFEPMFSQLWDKGRLGPTTILINAQTRVKLTQAVLAQNGGAQTNVRLGEGSVRTGTQVESVLNPYTGQFIGLETHPYLPKGTAVLLSERLPYAVPGVRSPWRIETRQEYYSIKWPYRTRKDEFGVYVDEGLIGMVPFAHAVIQDIG
jgi:hypothetical protein